MNLKIQDSIRSLWDNFKYTNICIMGVQEGGESKKLETYMKKKMIENFPNLVKEVDIQVQEAQKVPNKMDAKRSTPRHMVIKMAKVYTKRGS